MEKLKQGSKSIREYAQEFKTLVRRSELYSTPGRLVSRFINGLNDDTFICLGHHNCLTLEEIIEATLSVESSLLISETVDKQVDGMADMGSSLVEESIGDVSEEKMVDDENVHNCLMEELPIDSGVLKIEPLLYTPRADDRHRYFYVLILSFNLLYSNLLMGLRSGAGCCDDILPVRAYNVLVGIHWSLSDGYIYWRRVILVCGTIVVQEVAHEWEVSQLLPGVNDSHIVMRSDSYGDDEVNVNYWDCVWDPGWFDGVKPLDKNMGFLGLKVYQWMFGSVVDRVHDEWFELFERDVGSEVHWGDVSILVYGYFGRLFIPQDSLECWGLRFESGICYSTISLAWIGANLGDRGKSYVRRDTHIKQECERYMSVLRGYRPTCEGNYRHFISNLFLQVFVRLMMLELLLDANHDWQVLYPLDSSTNLLEERGNVTIRRWKESH